MASDDDDIERLLREVDALESGPSRSKAQPPAPGRSRALEPVAEAPPQRSARVSWALWSAAGGGVLGFILGTVLFMLPWVSGPSTAVGAALGAAIAGLISGPPGWYRK